MAAQDRVAPLDRVDERVFSSREGAAGETMVTGGHLVSGAVPGSVAGLATRVRQGSKSQLDYATGNRTLQPGNASIGGGRGAYGGYRPLDLGGRGGTILYSYT